MKNLLTLLLLMFLFFVSIQAQENLLKYPSAESDDKSWKTYGDAKIGEFDGNKAFVIRNGGYFLQDVILPEQSAGKYTLLIGKGMSERIFSDDDITDHPYLYGYLMNEGKIYTYLQGQNTLWKSNVKNQWQCLWGIYQISEESDKVRFFLNQALRRGTERDGSAARFDNVGLYVFEKKAEADNFVMNFCGRNN